MNDLQVRNNLEPDRDAFSRKTSTPAATGLVGASGQAPKLEDRWKKPVILPNAGHE